MIRTCMYLKFATILHCSRLVPELNYSELIVTKKYLFLKAGIMIWLLIVRSLMMMTIWIQKRNIIRILLSLNLRHECNKNIIWWPVLIFKCIHYLLSRIATDENELSRVIFFMLILNPMVALPFSSEHIAFIILCCEDFGILQIRE